MLCNWKSGDIITAHHLNQMVCAINDNTKNYESLNKQFNDKGTSSINSTGGIDMGAFMGTALEPCESCWNRGFVRTGWEYSASDTTKEGIYANTSGVHNAISNTLTGGCMICLKNQLSGLPDEDIVLQVCTDCYGKIISQKIVTQDTTSCVNNSYWQGPLPSGDSAPGYSFIRRIGRIVQDYEHPVSMDDSTPTNKVISTNDLVMPILPARAEKEEKTVCKHSISLIGNFKENSILIKNIANTGGLCFDTSCQSRVSIKSGVEFHKACVKESTDSCGSSTTTTWPTIAKHIEPKAFDITVACIPVKEKHYKWDPISSSWIPHSSSDSISEAPCAETKGSIKIQAKSLCGHNWQIGWASSGEIEIPVKDFNIPEVTEYKQGRGINIVICKENTGTEEEPYEVTYYKICNTMQLCSGCFVTVCEPTCGNYKISACKTKIEAGEGIKVEEIDRGWKITSCNSCIKLKAGKGISVSNNANCWTICNTLKEISVAAGDGICVKQNNGIYTVSLKSPCSTCNICICGITYSFDPNWFTVTGNNVTLNQTKINEVASSIAINTTVNASVTNVLLDSVTGHFGSGQIVGGVCGLENGLNASGSIQRV